MLKIGDIISVSCGNQLYTAKVIKIAVHKCSPKYYVHYLSKQWNSSWDEWVEHERTSPQVKNTDITNIDQEKQPDSPMIDPNFENTTFTGPSTSNEKSKSKRTTDHGPSTSRQ